MTYTNDQLRRTLAKMLPEEKDRRIIYRDGLWWNGTAVLDTELLHLCWLVEEALSDTQQNDQWSAYCTELNKLCCRIPCGINPLCGYTIHATWQQRTIALAKVKGVEIVCLA